MATVTCKCLFFTVFFKYSTVTEAQITKLKMNVRVNGYDDTWLQFGKNNKKSSFKPLHDKTNKMACVPREDEDQPGHLLCPQWVTKDPRMPRLI